MRASTVILAWGLFASASSHASGDDEIFIKGKPVPWVEEDVDRRFQRTRVAKALESPPKDPRCARVLGTLLMAVAEAAPYLHRRDQNFFLDPGLVAVLDEQTSNDRFPATQYVAAMIRRVMIDRKAPEAWLETGKQLKTKHKVPLDLARLAYAADGPQLIDSAYFQLVDRFGFARPLFHDLWVREVLLAPEIARASATDRFQDRYVDRDVTWAGLVLVDIQKEKPAAPPTATKPRRGRKGAGAPDEDDEELKPFYLATLVAPLGKAQPRGPADVLSPKKQEYLMVRVRLQPSQYVDPRTVVRSGKYVAHGRFWGFVPGSGQPGSPTLVIELRDGLLFEDHDWSGYAGLATPDDVAGCEFCVHDLSPLGLKQHQGVGTKDGFGH